MIVEGQKAIEYIPAGQTEMLPLGTDWQSRHTEAERRKAEIRGRIHKQTDHCQKTAKDYFRPAKPTPSIYDSNLKRVAVYTRVSTSSEEQISSIENQTLYYTKKIAETENWTLQNIYSDEGKSGTSLRKRDAFKRMMQDAKERNSDMNSGRIMNLLVTIPAESRRVHIGKDIIRILGSPDYICVLQRKDRKSIVITPCAAVHPMSFRVPDKLLTDGQCKMRINGMGFVQSLLDANGLVTGKDYQFSGRYDIEKNAVVISLAANEKGNLISLKEFGASGTL